MKIFISIGHNNAFNFINDHGKFRLSIYRDQGASSGDTTEFSISKKIADGIKNIWDIPGVDLVIVPEGLNLNDRIKYINKMGSTSDICIELHMDSAPFARGCSTWFMSGSSYAEGLAKKFQIKYTQVTGLRGRGVNGDKTNRLGKLAFVRDTNPIALLLEMGFISNEQDRSIVLLRAAEGIYRAIKEII